MDRVDGRVREQLTAVAAGDSHPARDVGGGGGGITESARYSTASPLNGGVNDCAEEPPVTGAPAVVCSVEGLNHSTFKT